MMLNKRVSIIIPVYNTKQDYLIECIESCLNQTYKNIEIIIIDDGSTEKYAELFDRYSSKVKLYSIAHSGVSEARNYGINKSKGYWVFFLDSDDYLNDDSIEKLINISKNGYDIVISSTQISNKGIMANDNKIISNNKNDLLKSIFNNNYLYKCIDTPWGKLYKKSLIIDNNIMFNSHLIESEDGLFNFEIYYHANKIFLSNEVLYNYRLNSESLCNKYKLNQDINCNYLIKEYIKLSKTFNLSELESDLNLFSLRLFCRLLRKFYSKENKYKNFKYKIDQIDGQFKKCIIDNKYKNISNGRKLILYLYKNNHLYLLYKLCKLELKIK